MRTNSRTRIVIVTLILVASAVHAQERTGRLSAELFRSHAASLAVADGTSGRPSAQQTWDTTARTARDPEAICGAVRSRVKYAADTVPEDEWREGHQTWERRAGDCDDFAVCVDTMCKEKGEASSLYVVASKTTGAAHAVVIGNSNGRMWMSSNGAYENVNSLEDAKDKIARQNGWYTSDVRMREQQKQEDKQ